MDSLFIHQARIEWEQLSASGYLQNIEAFHGVECLSFQRPVTFFVGENGSGKSTLLEAMAIAYGFNPEGGTRNYSFSTRDSHSPLAEAIRLGKGHRRATHGYFLRAESFYNVATQEEVYARSGLTPIPSRGYHEKSHGESFLALAQDYLRPEGVYFFDEPEAALSPQRQLTLLLEISRCVQEGSQFFIVSHSPILLALPGAELLTFDRGPVHACTYEETDSYQITKMFIQNREKILSELLERKE